jgi:hypothetical protein
MIALSVLPFLFPEIIFFFFLSSSDLKVVCFRYILEVLQPGPKAVINVLEILTRIVRHSRDSALAVTCCPRLLSIIITNFIPRDWRGIGLYQQKDNITLNSLSVVDVLNVSHVSFVLFFHCLLVLKCKFFWFYLFVLLHVFLV